MMPPLAIATLLFVAAVTPGPNNLVVMRIAAGNGFVRAIPALGGVVFGGCALLAVVAAGLGPGFAQWPMLRTLVRAGGAAYLVWLGLSLLRSSHVDHREAPLPAGVFGLFAFQFLNPKAWLMMLAVVAATPAHDALATFVQLAPLTAGMSAACLMFWMALGHALSLQLRRPLVRRWSDRVFGALMIASALMLFA
ncbi:MAG: LysE family translocator [Dokdonella sp.]